MNELARIVHDLVTGKELDTDCLAGLSPEERAALVDLRSVLRHSAGGVTCPSDMLVAYDWVSPPPVISSIPP